MTLSDAESMPVVPANSENEQPESSMHTSGEVVHSQERPMSIRDQEPDRISKLRAIVGRFRPRPDLSEHDSRISMVATFGLFPACATTARKFKGDTVLLERLRDALTYGAIHLGQRPALYRYRSSRDNPLSRNQENVFQEEVRALTALFSQVGKDGSDKPPYYFLDEDTYEELIAMLETLLTRAKPLARERGMTLPPLPMWGGDTRYVHYSFTANDFEILGACFRREVEYFLFQVFMILYPPDEAGHVSVSKDKLRTTAREKGKEKEELGFAWQDASTQDEDRTPRKRDPPPHLPAQAESVSQGFRTLHGQDDFIPTTPTKRPVKLPLRLPDHEETDPEYSEPPRRARATKQPRDRRDFEEFRLGYVTRSPHAAQYEQKGTSSLVRLFQRTKPSPIRNPRDVSDEEEPRRGGTRDHQHPRRRHRSSAADPDPSDSSSDDDGDRRRRERSTRRRPPSRDRRKAEETRQTNPREAHFDFKLKTDVVPAWDGNTDTLARWILRINSIAKKSNTIREQLGTVVPQRLTGSAEEWYFSLPEDVREECEQNWENVRDEIGNYYMNRSWQEKTRRQALAIRYRESGHTRELPSQYFIRKRELLELVYEHSQSELITEIMTGAPLAWRTILTPRLYRSTADLQRAIKLHEDDLLELDQLLPSRTTPPAFPSSRDPRYPPSTSNGNSGYRSRVHLAGGIAPSPNHPPPFPKDDSNVSRKGTPESKGRRPCRHCGSGKHWDYECRYARQGTKQARANFVEYSPEEIAEQEAYDAFYYDELPDSETDDPDGVANCRIAEAQSPSSPGASETDETRHTVRTFTVSTHQPTPKTMQGISQKIARVFTGREPSRKRRRESSEGG
ncbi:hypothetical protein C2E23DRAFT_882214 [Lenzites betulinus]|nr:hypothetical protein C2E23DRAFT_882214 [Lenzites betulinus]